MMKQWIPALVLFVAAATSSSNAHGSTERWFHLQVVPRWSDGPAVDISLPLGAVQTAIATVPDEEFLPDEVSLDGENVSVADLRAMWQELADDSAAVVDRRLDGSLVRVVRLGEMVALHVEHPTSGRDVFHLEVAQSLVEQLLTGDGRDFNLEAALLQVDLDFAGEVLRSETEDASIRVWIDSSAGDSTAGDSTTGGRGDESS